MNEFEKWFTLECQNIVGHYDYHEEVLAKLVWKAALEWVIEGMHNSSESFNLYDAIIKELKDGSV